jgi:hypothetical protein
MNLLKLMNVLVYGDTPYVVRGGQADYKRLFYSDQNKALTKPITLPGGFGVIKGGTVMGILSESTNRVGMYTPYTPEGGTWAGAGLQLQWPGVTYVTQDLAVNKLAYVKMEDSYRFVVGDHICGLDTDDTETDAGAIVSIDRTTYSHVAVITVSTNFATATVIKGAIIFHQQTTGDPFVLAKGFLLSSVDTGIGENSKGAQATLVLSNAIVYTAALLGYNSDVTTDLGSSSDGKFTIFK